MWYYCIKATDAFSSSFPLLNFTHRWTSAPRRYSTHAIRALSLSEVGGGEEEEEKKRPKKEGLGAGAKGPTQAWSKVQFLPPGSLIVYGYVRAIR